MQKYLNGARTMRSDAIKNASIAGYPALLVGLLLDLIVNTFVATLIFVELPREFTVSARLTRHSESTGWRQRVAVAIRTALLDNIDPNGVHRG